MFRVMYLNINFSDYKNINIEVPQFVGRLIQSEFVSITDVLLVKFELPY